MRRVKSRRLIEVSHKVVIRWNYGALRVDGIGAEGKDRHTELAIGTIGLEHCQSRIEPDTKALRGYNQPAATLPLSDCRRRDSGLPPPCATAS